MFLLIRNVRFSVRHMLWWRVCLVQSHSKRNCTADIIIEDLINWKTKMIRTKLGIYNKYLEKMKCDVFTNSDHAECPWLDEEE